MLVIPGKTASGLYFEKVVKLCRGLSCSSNGSVGVGGKAPEDVHTPLTPVSLSL